MLIENQKIEVKWIPKTKKYYISKGYKFTNYGDVFKVKIHDLPLGSDYEVSYICDYCGKKSDRKYEVYNKIKRKSTVNKDTCKSRICIAMKTKEQNIVKYGVESPLSLENVKNKIAKTNMERYGVANVFEHEEFQNKARETVIKKYGVDNIFKSEEFQETRKITNLKKYGVEHHMSLPEFQNKSRETRIKNHGKYYTKASYTFVNGVACSKKQLELGIFLKGEINKHINNKIVDIYLEEYNLVIEYDGKGHDLSVIFGEITKEDFRNKEINRNKDIMNEGMTLLRIVNTRDKEFSNEIVLDFITKDIVTNNINILVIS